MNKLVTYILCGIISFGLVGCGKGGGKEGSKESSSVTITEKGESTISVKEGDSVAIFLELDSFSGAKASRLEARKINKSDVIHEDPNPSTGVFANGDVQYIKFIKIKGPDIESEKTITPYSKNKQFGISFIAPDTKGAATVEYEYKIIMVNDKGASDESVRKITVLGVNNPPVIKLAPTAQVSPNQSVSLYATETTDIDGSVASYGWVQISGTNVTLANTNQATLNFIAPNSVQSEQLVFQLTATDNLGATSTQKVTVTVVPLDPPTVSIRFPSATSYTTANYIRVSGYASAKNGATIKSIRVQVDNDTVITTMNGNSWSVSSFDLPTALDSVPVVATVEDSQGKISEARATIQRKAPIVSDLKWNKLIGLDINPLNGGLLALINDNSLFDDYALATFSFDSKSTDKRLYEFPNAAFDSVPRFDGTVATAFNVLDNKYYVSSTVQSVGKSTSLIHSVDLTAKKMTQIYPLDINKDVSLASITGIAVDRNADVLVADGVQSKLYSIDPDKFEFKVQAEGLFPVDKVNFISLAADPFAEKFSPYLLPNKNEMPLYGLNKSTKLVEQIAGDFSGGTTAAKRFVVDEVLNTAYVLDTKGDVYRLNLKNNTHGLFAKGPIGDIAYDPVDSILYFYYTDSKSIHMIDVFSGESVEVTRSKSDVLLK